MIKHVTLQKIVAHDFRYDPRISYHETHMHIHQPMEQAPYSHSRKIASNLKSKCTYRLIFGSVKPQRLSHHYGLDVYLGKSKMSEHNEITF